MRPKVLALVSILMVTGFLLLQSIAPQAAMAASSWKDIPGPGNGDATALAYDSVHNVLYRATSSRGVFRYNATGWTDAGGAISGYEIDSLAYDPTHNVLYAGCFDPKTGTGKGVWACSTPNTAPSWSDTGGGVSSYQITALAYNKVRNSLYAGCYDTSDYTGHGVWACSTPNTTPGWSNIGGGVSSYQVPALAFDEVRNLLYAGCFDPSDYSGKGVWACSTPDTAPTWNSTGGGVSSYQIDSLAYDSVHNMLFAGCLDTSSYTYRGVWACSTPDTAPAWNSTGGGVSDSYVCSLACDPGHDVLYATTGSNQVWACASPDTAPTWGNTSGAIFTRMVRSLTYDSNHNVVYAGTDGIGVWSCVTPNTTPVWNDTGGGVSNLTVKAMAYDSLHQILYAGMGYNGIWACNATDEAPTWSRDLGFSASPLESLAYDSAHNVLYAGTGNSGIWACANPDTAPSWTNTGGGAGIYMVPSLAYDSINNVLYAATVGGGVWACAAPNTAPVWTGIGMSGGGWHGDIDSLAYDAVHNLLYTGVYGFGVWVCANPNTTPAWADTGGISIYSLPSLYYDSVHNVLYAGTWGGYGVFACATPDTTPVWTNTGGGVSGYSIFSLAYDAGRNVLYAGAYGQGVWECTTPNTAPNWSTTDGRASNYQIDSLAYDPGNNVLYAGTDLQGAWYYSADPAPVISSISPTSGPVGTDVTINGSDFGSVQGVSTVTFNGTKASNISWTDTKIDARVPAGAKTGPVAVTTSQGVSNADKVFTVTTPTPPPATRAWYLAEGTNAWGFSTYITIENPNDSSCQARLTYMDPNPPAAGKGILKSRTITLPARSQTTVSSTADIGAVDFSTKVEALDGKQIAVDRTMFWTGAGTSARGYHSSIGTDTLSKTWYLPEGSSNWGFETWTAVLNPNGKTANITLTYMTETGPRALNKTIPPDSRATWNMASDVGGADASIKVASDIPVVAERSMYNANRREGSCSIGAPAPATDFYLSEGAVGHQAGFTTWVLLQNPDNTENQVSLTFQTGTGQVAGPTFTMRANSRKTIKVNDYLPANTDVSTKVHGTKPLVAERAMYWDVGTGQCFHASIGLSEPHMTFMCPDGQVGQALTYTLVQNPNPGAVTVRITYLPQGGGKATSFTAEIPKESRATFNMADKISTGRAAILVESLDGARPIMVERSMYGADWGSGTNTIGCYSN